MTQVSAAALRLVSVCSNNSQTNIYKSRIQAEILLPEGPFASRQSDNQYTNIDINKHPNPLNFITQFYTS